MIDHLEGLNVCLGCSHMQVKLHGNGECLSFPFDVQNPFLAEVKKIDHFRIGAEDEHGDHVEDVTFIELGQLFPKLTAIKRLCTKVSSTILINFLGANWKANSEHICFEFFSDHKVRMDEDEERRFIEYLKEHGHLFGSLMFHYYPFEFFWEPLKEMHLTVTIWHMKDEQELIGYLKRFINEGIPGLCPHRQIVFELDGKPAKGLFPLIWPIMSDNDDLLIEKGSVIDGIEKCFLRLQIEPHKQLLICLDNKYGKDVVIIKYATTK